MIELVVVFGGLGLVMTFLFFFATVFPLLWDALLRYIDKTVEKEVAERFESELRKRRAEVYSLEAEIRSRKDTIVLLKEAVGRKIERGRVSPIGGEMELRPAGR